MKIAVLLNGPPRHGVVRATRTLVEAAADDRFEVIRCDDPFPDAATVAAFAAAASRAGAALMHYSPYTDALWGPRESRAARVVEVASRVGVPVALFCHDIRGETRAWRWSRAVARAGEALRTGRALRGAARELAMARFAASPSPEAAQLAALARVATGFVVSNEIEGARLRAHGLGLPIGAISHFIEVRRGLRPRDEAKAALGLSGRRVTTLLGYVFPNKGHDRALEALRLLPDDVTLMFAGGAVESNQGHLDALLARAQALGCADRLRVTGWLEDEAMDLVISATDVAVCPFHSVSASGSLSTWIAGGAPIVASDLPLLRAYADEFGPAIRLVDTASADRLAAALEAAFATPAGDIVAMRAAAARYAPELCAARLSAFMAGLAGGETRPISETGT